MCRSFSDVGRRGGWRSVTIEHRETVALTVEESQALLARLSWIFDTRLYRWVVGDKDRMT